MLATWCYADEFSVVDELSELIPSVKKLIAKDVKD
jgi:hypothetical protein